jgi:hypothetical protein
MVRGGGKWPTNRYFTRPSYLAPAFLRESILGRMGAQATSRTATSQSVDNLLAFTLAGRVAGKLPGSSTPPPAPSRYARIEKPARRAGRQECRTLPQFRRLYPRQAEDPISLGRTRDALATLVLLDDRRLSKGGRLN